MTIIHNGDHLEYELENQNTRPEDRDDWPLPSFDGLDWAKAFGKTYMVQQIDGKIVVSRIAGYATKPVEDQDGLMLAWFSGALMRGFDEGRERMSNHWWMRLGRPIIRFQLNCEEWWFQAKRKFRRFRRRDDGGNISAI